MLRAELGTSWTVRASAGDRSGRVPETYPAEVPGCVHTDLMAAGVIPDPYLDGNEAALRWMYDIDWRYAARLDADVLDLRPPGPGERIDLVFDGIDTVGTVRLGEGPDKIELGRTYNMHRSYRFDIHDAVIEGRNDLSVTFTSATRRAEELRASAAPWPSASFGRPYNYIRKMACSWGWDWGPSLTTAGIWRDARIECWTGAALGSVRPTAHIDPDDASRAE